jgi:tetratricopeptide (TPR) repeat protein
MRALLLTSIVAVGVMGGLSTSAFASSPPEAGGLAYEAIQKGQWSEAETILRQGLAQDPNDPMRLLNLAYVLQSSGRSAEATSVYEQVLQLDRDPLVAVGPDKRIKAARAKILAKKGMAAIQSSQTGTQR